MQDFKFWKFTVAQSEFTKYFLCLSVCFSLCLSVCLSIYLSLCLSVFLSPCLSFSLSVFLSVCLSFSLSLSVSLALPVCLSLYPCLSLSLSLSVSLSLYVCLSFSLCLPVSLSLSPSLSVSVSLTLWWNSDYSKIFQFFMPANLLLAVGMLHSRTVMFPRKGGEIRVLAGIAPSSQTVWALLRTPDYRRRPEKFIKSELSKLTAVEKKLDYFGQRKFAIFIIWQSMIILGSGSIRLGINYSVSNETKLDE